MLAKRRQEVSGVIVFLFNSLLNIVRNYIRDTFHKYVPGRYSMLLESATHSSWVLATWMSKTSPIISFKTTAHLLYLPPSVAESRKWVPYFLMMLSVMALRLGLLPSCLMVCRNSGSSGKEKPLFSCLSRAKLFTFQRPNSLQCMSHKNTLNRGKAHTTHEC